MVIGGIRLQVVGQVGAKLATNSKKQRYQHDVKKVMKQVHVYIRIYTAAYMHPDHSVAQHLCPMAISGPDRGVGMRWRVWARVGVRARV